MGKAVRLDKFLADAGVGTRSEVKKYIQKGKVQVNGVPAKKLIIEAHHGNIRAGNSDKYGGAQFKIILPLYKFKGKL